MTNNIQLSQIASGAPLKVKRVKRDSPICGFWKRILALFLDGIFLGVVGIFLGFLFGKQLAQIGGWGRLFGFAISLGYFGLLNSRFGKGQSIGKKITKICVVGYTGEYIPFRTSLLRTTILTLPFFLTGIMLPPSSLITLIRTAIQLFAFGIGLIIISFYSGSTRQFLHDVVCKTYVVKTDTVDPITVNPIDRSLGFLAITLICVLAFCVDIVPRLISKKAFTETFIPQNLQRHLYKMENVSFAYVIVDKAITPKGISSYISANVFYKQEPVVLETKAEQVARVILNGYPQFRDKDIIKITVTYGYDIGIASSWRKHSISLSPSKWRDRLEGKSKEDGSIV